MSERAASSDRQAFLVGEQIYLRNLRLDHADAAPIWRTEPWPAPIEAQRDRLKKRFERDDDAVGEDQIYLIVRRSDDRPLGSASVSYMQARFAFLDFHIDPNRPLNERGEIAGAASNLLFDHLRGETQCMKIATTYLDLPGFVGAAEKNGMRLAVHQREAFQESNRRFDLVTYEALSPSWVERLGMPRGLEEGPVERAVRSPAKRLKLDADDFPVNCVMPGERVYLRVFEPDESELIEQWSREETEVIWTSGRLFQNSIHYRHFSKVITEKEPPQWVRFAIALRETGELIGINGLYGLDLVHQKAETETEIFRPEFRNGGYGTEAKHLLLEYAFERLGLHMVYSWVAEVNRRSAAALRKQGYRDCGYLAWHKIRDDDLVGEFVFDLLADEWRAARDAQV